MSKTTTEVVEEIPSPVISFTATLWPKWTISSLPGILPFLPKVPGHRRSVGLLQQLSPRVIKSECILTRRFLSVPSSTLAASQPKDSTPTAPARVQTIRNGTTITTPTIPQPTSRLLKKQDVINTLSIIASALLKLSIFKSLLDALPKFLRPSKEWLSREFLTSVAVYSGLMVLVVEGSGCLLGLLAGSMPPGLIFMISALLIMMVIAIMTIGHDPNAGTHAILSPSSPATSASQKRCRLR